MAAFTSMRGRFELCFLVGCMTALACGDASRERPGEYPSLPAAGAHQTPPAKTPSSDTSVELDAPHDAGTPNPPAVDASTSAGLDGSADAEPARDGSALAIHCGEIRMHDTTVEGRPDTFRGYGCTQRFESGRETIYTFRAPVACRVTATLSNLSTDLDLFALRAADPLTCEKVSSTPLDLQTIEQITFDAAAGSTRFLVVDGYAKSTGSYTLELSCACDG